MNNILVNCSGKNQCKTLLSILLLDDNRLNSEGLFNAGLTLEESPEVRNAPLDVSLQSLDPSSNGENVPIQHSGEIQL